MASQAARRGGHNPITAGKPQHRSAHEINQEAEHNQNNEHDEFGKYAATLGA